MYAVGLQVEVVCIMHVWHKTDIKNKTIFGLLLASLFLFLHNLRTA